MARDAITSSGAVYRGYRSRAEQNNHYGLELEKVAILAQRNQQVSEAKSPTRTLGIKKSKTTKKLLKTKETLAAPSIDPHFPQCYTELRHVEQAESPDGVYGSVGTVQTGPRWPTAECGAYSGIGTGVEAVEEDGIRVTPITRQMEMAAQEKKWDILSQIALSAKEVYVSRYQNFGPKPSCHNCLSTTLHELPRN
jgi:hypothetical protein